MYITRSLESYRQERLLGIGEFAAFLGITEQTYRRLLKQPERVRPATKRQILERLDIPSPYYVTEFVPAPTEAEVASVLSAIEEGDRIGWVRCDPETLEETGEVVDGTGKLLHRYDPATEEPWPV
jgi:hypothetical protein